MDIFYIILCIAGLLSTVVVFFELEVSPFVSVLLLVFIGYLYFAAISSACEFMSAEDVVQRVLIGGVVRWMIPSVILVGNVLYLRWRGQVPEGSVNEKSEGEGE